MLSARLRRQHRRPSVVVYDVWTRTMLANGQEAPSLNSFADIDTNDDGSVTVTFGPEEPAGGTANWIRTVPDKGWFPILRLYGPTDGYFDPPGSQPTSPLPDRPKTLETDERWVSLDADD